MNDEEYEEFQKIPEEIDLYRGCSMTEVDNNQYRTSWTDDIITAIYFAFFAYIKKDFSPKDRVVIQSRVNKNSIIAVFNTSIHGNEREKIVLLSNNDSTSIFLNWSDFCESDRFKEYHDVIKNRYHEKYYVIMNSRK